MDAQSLIDILENSDDDSPASPDKHEEQPASFDDVPLAKGRQKKSLGNLATRFAELLRNTPDGVMHIDKVIDLLSYRFLKCLVN